MDQNFQTSFIPKKPIVEERSSPSRPIGFLTIISIFVFFTMALSVGGVYFYKSILAKQITELGNSLNLAKNRFEPQQITRLQQVDKRLTAANEILSRHIAISPVFQIIGQVTEKGVRYTKFSYTAPESGDANSVTVKMSGQALNYRTIAMQADLFSKNKNIIDPVFSNLSLDDKGSVLFDLTFSIDRKLVDYKQVLATEGSNTPSVDNTKVDAGTLN